MAELKDLSGRKIDYLRISITDRCNLRCQYCMPAEGVDDKTHEGILSYEDLAEVVRVGVSLGIKKVRITGGEPLVRLGVVDFVRQLRAIEGLEKITLTTNGILLAKYALPLKEAGLDRVNISLDSLQPEKFAQITRRDQYAEVLKGIHTALAVGLNPVKINVVAMSGVNDDEFLDFVELTRKYPLHVRFIEFMPLGGEVPGGYISLDDVRLQILEHVELMPAEIEGSGPAKAFRIPDGLGTIGFIAPVSHSFCGDCNRLRLTADGRLRPCLASNLEIDLHDSHGQFDRENLEANLRKAILLKPGEHHFYQETDEISQRKMSQIGG